jgi:hypothetical protein
VDGGTIGLLDDGRFEFSGHAGSVSIGRVDGGRFAIGRLDGRGDACSAIPHPGNVW